MNRTYTGRSRYCFLVASIQKKISIIILTEEKNIENKCTNVLMVYLWMVV